MYVYLITNLINGKQYVGCSKYHPDSRFKTHVYDSKKSERYFHRALRKYGPENFKIEILEQIFEDNIKLLKQREIFFIEQYKPEYNMTKGGDGVTSPNVSASYRHYMSEIRPYQISGKNNPFYGKHHTEESKEKNRKAHLGKTHSEETKQLLSEKNKGKKMTEEQIQKFVEKRSMIWEITPPNKPSFYIKNLSKFCKENNLDQRNMTKVAAGVYKTSKGYKCNKIGMWESQEWADYLKAHNMVDEDGIVGETFSLESFF